MASTQEKIRYGIIGFGLFAERAIAPAINASENSELVAIQKRSLPAAREKAKEYGIPLAFDSAEQLVAHRGVDAVFIVSANAMHCSETLAAANAGKHVLVEKPMAMNTAEAERMIEACRAANVKLMVGHMLRFSPLVRKMKKIVQSGMLGDIIFANAEFMYDGSSSPRSWLFDVKLAGGGPVFDIGVHCLDTLRFTLQDEVTVTKSVLLPRPTETHTEHSAKLALQFSKGTLGSIYCSFDAPFRRTFVEIIGTQGSVSASDFTHNNAIVPLTVNLCKDGKKEKTEIEEIEIPNLYVDEITNFSESILKNTEPLVPGSVGFQNQIVLDAAMKS
ncbi:MAG: Gfo/Idh/MocA family oxidoreductase [Bacteroidota bacterium]|nr:Gfo/Idh/MocA family oxidoreductase [Bacteroidota bacterium]